MAHINKSTSTPLRRRQPKPDRSYVPRLPHGSWRLAQGAGHPAGISSAGDFWNRLGL